MWFVRFLTSSIGQKWLMAVSGLMLLLFLCSHIAGVATLYLSNTYAIDTGGSVAQRVLLYPSDDTTVFAYQAGAGLEIAINRILSLDAGYRYFGTAKGTFEKDVTRNVDLKYESHSATLGFRVKF